MPYFVYVVRPFGQLEQLAEHAAFKEASTDAKARRAALPPGGNVQVRVMFADNALAAEDLLLQVRAPSGAGDDEA